MFVPTFFLLFSMELPQTRLATPAAMRSCKQVESCAEAVEMWCGGYRRADADGDGVPCENVCPNLQRVEEIRKEIGC